jgi:streptogramin lyase
MLLFLLLLSNLSYNMSIVHGFSNNQEAVITIGQWKSPSYGILNPEGGLVLDSSGNLWVSDAWNSRVLSFKGPFSSNMSASLVIGQLDFTGNGRGLGSNRLDSPMGIAFDREGNLWVADLWNSRVLEFEPPFYNGMDASVAVGQSDLSSNALGTTRNGLKGPWGIAFDSSGDLWVADSGNSRVVEFQPPFSTNMNASLVLGQPDFAHNYCNPAGASSNCGTRSILNSPVQVAFDPSGDLWVLESPNSERLLEFKPPFRNGNEASLVMGPISDLSSLAFDSSGNLWMGYTGLGPDAGVYEFESPSANRANATLKVSGYPGDYWSQNIAAPTWLTFDSFGNLWVVDFRYTWLENLPGRVLGFDAHPHSLNTPGGRVYFDTHDGLLAPLTSIPVIHVGSLEFPDGLFNFTIQGLPAGGSAIVTISFSHTLPAGAGWWSYQDGRWVPLDATQIQIAGDSLTITLGDASQSGVISELGGPSSRPANATVSTETSTTTIRSQTQNPGNRIPGFPTESILVGVVLGSCALYLLRSRRLFRKRLPLS